MDLIVFGGQSNMQGQSECLSENDVVKDAYEYKWLTDEVVPLKNPVGEDITYEETCGSVFSEETDQADWLQKHVTGSACFGHTNLVPAFCRAYTQISGRNVTAVHIAKGSTVIADWLPGSRGYEILVKKAAAARKKVNPDRVFFVWLQGESDAIFKSTAGYYKEALNRFCDALKKEIGICVFGLIRVGKFTNDERDEQIMAAQNEICRENPDFMMLTDIAAAMYEQPVYMNPYVQGHYSAKGLEKLGREAGKALAEGCML